MYILKSLSAVKPLTFLFKNIVPPIQCVKIKEIVLSMCVKWEQITKYPSLLYIFSFFSQVVWP